MATTYFTFELDDGSRTGLVRHTRDDEGLTLERVDRAGDWIDDPNLIRHFADPGDSDLVAISKREAGELAKRDGVELLGS
jgi:predicted YcjX-like family ATPase